MRMASKYNQAAGSKPTPICRGTGAYKMLRIVALRGDITTSKPIAQALACAGMDISPEGLEP